LSWRVSTTLDIGFCLEALKAALEINCPDIFNYNVPQNLDQWLR